MNIAIMYVIGLALGIAMAWPRVTPVVVYYADPARGLYHADKDCAYSRSPTLPSRKRAEAANLNPCGKCLPQTGKQVARGNRQSSDGKAKNDVPKLTRHADIIGAR
jgi:hypothetical protein